MAQQAVQLDEEKLCCSICLGLLKDPVTVPCGHSYCGRCIEGYWSQDDQRETCSCPQCRHTFNPRPVLKKNTMLAEVVESLKETGLQDVPPDHCYAGPGDVACDSCTGRKLKAVKTCLQCLVSYCDTHLQPHYQSPAFKKHKLVKASSELQENICSRHDEVRKLFCRSDQQCICYLCSVEEHKGHSVVSAAAERAERQKELDTSQQNIKQRIQEREEDVTVLHQEVKSINHCADRAVEDSDTIFKEMISSFNGRKSEVRELIRDQQKREVSRAEELREHVEQEVTELRRRHAELEKISLTEDHIHFLHSYTSLSRISESTQPVSSNIRPLRYFEDVTVAVSKMRDKLEDTLKEEGTNVSETVNRVDVLLSTPAEPKTRAELFQPIQLEDILKIKTMKKVFVVILLLFITLTHPIRSSVQPQGTHWDQLGDQRRVQGHLNMNPGWLGFWWSAPTEPKIRAEFLQYSCPNTLDPNTAHQLLSLSKGNRKVTRLDERQSYPHHPERFTGLSQVLSSKGLTGRCYWEVEWRGEVVQIAVSYKDISRKGSFEGDRFGCKDTSWSLDLDEEDGYVFRHRDIVTNIPGPVSSRVGVYLDHSAGNLSFYSVSATMTLLHRVHTTFTQPLYAGLGVWWNDGDTAEFCDLK